jgi:hypothetical protein
MQFNGKNLPADGWQQMEDHIKIGYMFITAHNWLVYVYFMIYEKRNTLIILKYRWTVYFQELQNFKMKSFSGR